MTNDCENQLCVRLLNKDGLASDLDWWHEVNAGISTEKLPMAARHAFLMGASNVSVPRLAADFPNAGKKLSQDLLQHIFDLAATKHIPKNFKGRSGMDEELSFRYATPTYREDDPKWLNWNSKNWGTKWDCYETTVARHTNDDMCLKYDFYTAWGAPQAWLEAAATYWHVRAVVGKRVALHGLSREDLNGKRGRAIEYVAAKGRYLVVLDGAAPKTQPLGVQRANLRLAELTGKGSRELPSYSLELRFAECGCGFSGRTRWEGTSMVEEVNGEYGEYFGQPFQDDYECSDDEEGDDDSDNDGDNDDDNNVLPDAIS